MCQALSLKEPPGGSFKSAPDAAGRTKMDACRGFYPFKKQLLGISTYVPGTGCITMTAIQFLPSEDRHEEKLTPGKQTVVNMGLRPWAKPCRLPRMSHPA
jgi:hypothetical protein